ncbi:MAG TPA: triose-phosphate isomerase [Stellaceae bacterium]|jgi:triosephosphate isomerase|nr:triose-phosphate isomerase [Stellaceae bacterium]
MRKLIAGNWKMNGLRADGTALARELAARGRRGPPPCDLLVCPPATLLAEIAAVLAGSPIALGGQDCHAEGKGAFTGDISAVMLKDVGCAYVILGHSERRAHHHETDAMVRAKAMAGLAAGLIPIVCVGESAEQRERDETLTVIGAQVAGSLPDIAGISQIAIAYEPIWAIGSGRTPKRDEIAEVHAFIRTALSKRVANPDAVRILYGGSLNAKNAAEILPIANVDGGLVGGASLDAESFWTIAQAAN